MIEVPEGIYTYMRVTHLHTGSVHIIDLDIFATEQFPVPLRAGDYVDICRVFACVSVPYYLPAWIDTEGFPLVTGERAQLKRFKYATSLMLCEVTLRDL